MIRGVIGTDSAEYLYALQNYPTMIHGLGGNDNIYGGTADDTLFGGTGSDGINGNAGSDLLDGEDGDDVINGGDGNDSLLGNTGADIMAGGTGNDTYYVDSTGDIVTETVNEGTDTVFSSISYTLPTNIENLTLAGTLSMNGIGNGLDNVLTGNANTNILTGNAGNDTIDGSEGADTMTGGLGNDTFFVDNLGDIVTEAVNEGTDIVKSSVSYSLSANIENLTLTGLDDLDGTGNAPGNVITGNDADNILFGNDGNDYLYGTAGNDTLLGDAGDDVMYGGDGNDVLFGDSGNELLSGDAGDDIMVGAWGDDTLMGGEGSDTYQFSPGSGSDIVNDTGTDKGTDMIQFNRFVSRDTVAFFKDGSDLHIAYGDTDYITVLSQDAAGIEKVLTTKGWYLTDAEINTVIQQVTAYAGSNGISLASVDDVKGNQELMNIIVNTWHQ